MSSFINGFLSFGSLSYPSNPTYTNVVLRINGDGPNNSTTYIRDKSYSAKDITKNGVVKISTTQSKFGGSSIYFDGIGDYLSIADSSDFNFGSGNWCVECWIKSPGTNAYAQIMGQRDSAGNINSDSPFGLSRNNTASTLIATVYNGTSNIVLTSLSNVFDDNWHHVALVRYGNTIYLYIDGISEANTVFTWACTDSTKQFSIGRAGEYNGQYFSGYIDDIRVTKGEAVYTSNFLIPIVTFPTALDTDVYKANVVLAIHADGTNGSTTIIDETQKTITCNGNTALSTTQKKFGSSSIVFDGTGDYIDLGASSDFTFGTGDFTIECYFYITSLANQITLFEFRPDSTNGDYIYTAINTSGGGTFYVNNADRIVIPNSTISINTWYHWAVCRSGTSTKLFINGVQQGSTYTDSTNYLSPGTRGLRIGKSAFPVSEDFAGYIDDIRITKGAARYTSTFTPSSYRFSDDS